MTCARSTDPVSRPTAVPERAHGTRPDQARRHPLLQGRRSAPDRPDRRRLVARGTTARERSGRLKSVHRESPVKRTNPNGRTVWYARYTDSRGRRRSAGTFALKGEAQAAIDRAYRRVETANTLGAYFETWTSRHPRSKRTNDTNEHRISRVLKVDVEGRELRDWPLADFRRRHALALIDHLLGVQGRATTGVVGILRSLSAMTEDGSRTRSPTSIHFVAFGFAPTTPGEEAAAGNTCLHVRADARLRRCGW